MKKICIFHQYVLERRNEKVNNKYKHTYKCKKCDKKKIEYSEKPMRY